MKKFLLLSLISIFLVGCTKALVVYGSTHWYKQHMRAIHDDYANNRISYEEYIESINLSQEIHGQWQYSEEQKRNKIKRKRFFFF